MKTPLQVIASYGCPTTSYIAAVQHLCDREDLTIDQYIAGIQEIVGLTEPPEVESWHYAKTVFLYCVQETIRTYLTGIIPDMEVIYKLAIKRTYEYFENNPWSATRFNITHGLEDQYDDETGEVQSKSKGAKKEVTERIFKDMKSKNASRQAIINAFVHETGMSKAGATTYFHALKKEFGFKQNEATEKQVKPESKQELAERLYQESDDKSKATIITLFADKLKTSKLGAQTYYYACKNKFQPLTPADTTV